MTFCVTYENKSVDSSTSSIPSMHLSPPTDSYDIAIVDENDDQEEILQFIRNFFIRDEPLNHSLGLLKDRVSCDEVEYVKGFDSDLNLKAVSNGKIIGLCLNRILNKGYINKIEEVNCPDKKVEKIVKLLHHVAVESNIFGHFPESDKAITVEILSVDTAWRRRGVAKELINKTKDLARGHGCGFITVDCTSHFSEKAVKRLGFDCIYSLNYSDYKVNGEVALTPEKPHEAITVYSQRL